MKKSLESRLPDADMQAAPKALLRAARRARELGRQTGTGIVVIRNGQLIDVPPEDIDLSDEDERK